MTTQKNHATTETATPDPVFVSSVIGEGAAAHRLVKVNDATLAVWSEYGDDEPRMLDTDVAKRLGFKQPRDIRKLIERVWPEDRRPNMRATVARVFVGRGRKGVRDDVVNAYWLTAAQVLKVCGRSETPVAESILDDMIRVYMLASRGLLIPATAAPPQVRPEDIARMIDDALRAHLATMPAANHDGPVLHNDDRAVVLDPILTLAKRCAGGDATKRDVARLRGRIEHRVRAAVGWSSRWCLLPRVQTGAVCAALARESSIADQFVEAVAKSRQGSLRLVPVKPVAK